MKASFKAYRFIRVCCSLNRRGARSEADRAKWRRLRLPTLPPSVSQSVLLSRAEMRWQIEGERRTGWYSRQMVHIHMLF